MNTRNQRDQMYVFWFSEFPLQNYFHIKRGNGQVDSENIAGNKVEKKQLFCQLDFGTAEEKKKLFLSDVCMLISVRPWQLFLENKSQLRCNDFSIVRFTYQHINNGLGLDWDFQTSHKAQGCGLHPCRSSSKKSSGYESFQFPSGFWETVICSCVIPPINYFFYPFLPLGWML